MSLYKHQIESIQRITNQNCTFDTSDPGTGKTCVALNAFKKFKEDNPDAAALVFAPRTILKPAWLHDVFKFTPGLTAVIARAENRERILKQKADIYLTNHDAAKWIFKNRYKIEDTLARIDFLIVDESTAFKHRNSHRSKAMRDLIDFLKPKKRLLMSGTPNMNDLLHIWHQVNLLDDGERLGNNFYKFRFATCETNGAGKFAKWQPREGAPEVIADLISDIVIRNVLEECVDMPPNTLTEYMYELPAHVAESYHELRKRARLRLETGELISPAHAADVYNKLRQIASGTVYTPTGPALVDTGRYELVADLVDQREKCVIATQWAHQKEPLIKALMACDIPREHILVIDGSATDRQRDEAVYQFNNSDARVILANVATAGHGLTLTGGTTTIWPSPVSNAELFLQVNRRIYRNGQTKPTETIVIIAENTVDELAYNVCTDRVTAQLSLLELVKKALCPPANSSTPQSNSEN